MPQKRKSRDPYSFSKDSGAINVGCNVSVELHSRIYDMCNILEMSQSALMRYLLGRGMDDLEKRLAERVDALRKAEGQE